MTKQKSHDDVRIHTAKSQHLLLEIPQEKVTVLALIALAAFNLMLACIYYVKFTIPYHYSEQSEVPTRVLIVLAWFPKFLNLALGL